MNDDYGEIDVKQEGNSSFDTLHYSDQEDQESTPPFPLVLPHASPTPIITAVSALLPTFGSRVSHQTLQPVPPMAEEETIAEIDDTPPLRASTPITTQEGPPSPTSVVTTSTHATPPSSPPAGPSAHVPQGAEGGEEIGMFQRVTRRMSQRMKSPFKSTLPLGKKAQEVTDRLSQTAPVECEKEGRKKEEKKNKKKKSKPPKKPKKDEEEGKEN